MKRPIKITNDKKKWGIGHDTKIKEIFKLNKQQTRRIIKQMQAYGLETIGYGIDYNNTLQEHAFDQSISYQKFRNMLKSVNKKL